MRCLRALAPSARLDKIRRTGSNAPCCHCQWLHRPTRPSLWSSPTPAHPLLFSETRDPARAAHAGKRDAAELAAALDALHTRFQFLWGIYRTHSTAEDEIVFPALEAKDALHNISHSYTLDHHQEEALFRDIDGVLAALRDSSSATNHREEPSESLSPPPENNSHAERGRQLAHLTGMCTAMRVCLMKHLAIEDTELWPLFNVYFTVAEQQSVIGAIVGRSSAEVLQVMLPLIQAETSRQEEEEMLSSISLVTKNTNFDSWLKTWFVNPGSAEASASTDGATTAAAAAATAADVVVVAAAAAKGKTGEQGKAQMQQQQAVEMEGRLADMARYLEPAPEVASSSSSVGGVNPVSQVGGGGDELVVSWHNVFHLNQTQLQSAVLRVSRDEGLEPKRKAYLMQNLFTVRWLIAQQQGGGAADNNKPPSALSPPPAAASPSASASALTAAESSTTLPPPPPPPPPDDGSPSVPPKPVMHETHAVTSWHRQADRVLGCSHYARKAQLVAGCCQKVVPCRLCHDEQDTTHMLDRAATTHMVRVCLLLLALCCFEPTAGWERTSGCAGVTSGRGIPVGTSHQLPLRHPLSVLIDSAWRAQKTATCTWERVSVYVKSERMK